MLSSNGLVDFSDAVLMKGKEAGILTWARGGFTGELGH